LVGGVLLFVCMVVGADFMSAQTAPLLDVFNASGPARLFPVRDSVYVLVDPAGGANVTIQVGSQGALVVDAGAAAWAETVVRAVKSVSSGPLRYLVSTSSREEHVGGNAVVAASGRGFEGVVSLGLAARATGIAHENVMRRMSGLGEPAPTAAGGWPTLSFHTRRKEIHFNGETVQVLHQPAAHADGDSIVFFRSSDVIAAGDLYLTTTYPEIDLARGGSIDGYIDALNAIIDLTNTQKNQEGGTLVIPGHGRVSDEADVVEYRDMLHIIRGRIRMYASQGRTLEQILQARPTIDYDGRYAAASGPASARGFVETVYRSVVAATKQVKS
jgi:glyoxylase-like metal-dependent hydrolase (beta-lactamase superfamily II)